MYPIDSISLRIGKFYLQRRKLAKAAAFFRKGRRAIGTLNDQLAFAELLHNTGQPEDALAYLGEVIKQNNSSRAYERRAHILRELFREEEAIADLDEAIRMNDGNYINWYTRGLAYKDLGKFDEAIRDLKESIQREGEGTVVSTYYELAMAYFENSRFDEAAEYFRKCFAYERQAVPVYSLRLAQSLGELGSYSEAIEILLGGIALLDQYEAQPDQGYGLFAERTNYSYGAFKTFQRHIAPTYSFRLTLYEMYMKIDQHDKAEDALSDAIAKYPEASVLYFHRGLLRKREGKLPLAHSDFAQARRLEPDDYRAYFEQAKCYRQEGEEEEAFALLTEFYQRNPDSSLACYWLADSHYRLGNYKEALKLNAKLLELEDDDHLNFIQQAEIRLELDDYPGAEQAYSQAIALHDQAETHKSRGYAMYMQSKYEEALLELQTAAHLDPSILNDPAYFASLGNTYKAMNDWEFAIGEFTKALELDPLNARLFEYRANCYMGLRQYHSALLDCTQGLSADSSYSALYYLRSVAHCLLSDYGSAVPDALEFIEHHPGNPHACFHLGKIYYELGDEQAAIDAFDEVHRLDRAHAESYLFKAHVHYNRFDYAECVECIVNWSMNLGMESPFQDRVSAILALEGLDESLLRQAADKLKEMYGSSLYLS